MTDRVHDVVGIGVGPFNLGLAALLDGADADLDVRFLEQEPAFDWHEGMLVEETTMEVPFLADLVTMADPSNPYSYLNYLQAEDRLYEFYFYEEFFIPRREYNEYCRWVADRLPSLEFDSRVTDVRVDGDLFVVETVDPTTGERDRYAAEDVVMGIGTQRHVPEQFEDCLGGDVFHSASYLHNRERCLDADSVTIVGSGQSAAEVFRDLLERQADREFGLDWITRSRGFFQMADAKLGHMIYTPDYTEYFYDLDQGTKDELLDGQDLLYKGIDERTSGRIYDALYRRSVGDGDPDVGMLAATEVADIGTVDVGPDRSVSDRYQLICHHWQEDERFLHESDVVVLATGYARTEPPFLAPLEDRIRRDGQGRLAITKDFRLETDLPGEIFVQNAELHTHGINAPDLGLGPYRNATIVNGIVGEEVYDASRADTFQQFAVDEFVAERGARRIPESRPRLRGDD
ncbi:SidA/IucD/PvdA family monooxygenase [Halosimplex rubrum]|uniref:SidA/IucD/PvdA family monooxygenase n=1 Tax=Halosimplex rubrum TaxID=869889 RepID=A0A7D5SZ18_9EURY|nr:SidA/IucD/PvdA family monooxygenase [Halosimplex rubrum]QLH76768.1 SidA/IucD/PvdA family monooxygenase [Halosimplex rubrum]